MRPTNDRDPVEPVDRSTARIRNAVLNVLIGIGAMIAASGWLIRIRSRGPAPRPIPGLHDALLLALLGTAIGSYLTRRRWSRRSHVAAAAIAALGVPIGLAYGWLVDPRLEGVAPFWVIPIAMAILAIPRRGVERPPIPPSRGPQT
jgi:peptidoglycan/LPS O-acetylase OafA/YrhL